MQSLEQTLVLKLEKEREDALGEVKKLTIENSELQEVGVHGRGCDCRDMADD